MSTQSWKALLEARSQYGAFTDRAINTHLQSKSMGLAIAFILGVCVLVSACTTAMYGQSLTQDRQAPDQYTFKVYVGGFAGPETADNRAAEEIKAFMAKEGYSSYEIMGRHYNLVPSYYEYRVRLSRQTKTSN